MSARRWCKDCQAERDHWHIHGDPLEGMTREELLELARRQDLFISIEDVGKARFDELLAAVGRRPRA